MYQIMWPNTPRLLLSRLNRLYILFCFAAGIGLLLSFIKAFSAFLFKSVKYFKRKVRWHVFGISVIFILVPGHLKSLSCRQQEAQLLTVRHSLLSLWWSISRVRWPWEIQYFVTFWTLSAGEVGKIMTKKSICNNESNSFQICFPFFFFFTPLI